MGFYSIKGCRAEKQSTHGHRQKVPLHLDYTVSPQDPSLFLFLACAIPRSRLGSRVRTAAGMSQSKRGRLISACRMVRPMMRFWAKRQNLRRGDGPHKRVAIVHWPTTRAVDDGTLALAPVNHRRGSNSRERRSTPLKGCDRDPQSQPSAKARAQAFWLPRDKITLMAASTRLYELVLSALAREKFEKGCDRGAHGRQNMFIALRSIDRFRKQRNWDRVNQYSGLQYRGIPQLPPASTSQRHRTRRWVPHTKRLPRVHLLCARQPNGVEWVPAADSVFGMPSRIAVDSLCLVPRCAEHLEPH